MTEKLETFVVVCAWCQAVVDEKPMPPGQPGGVTHGICDDCWKMLMPEE